MVRSSKYAFQTLALLTIAVGLSFQPRVSAQDASSQSPYALLPDTTQAVVWVPSAEVILERWNRTELAKLASDPQISPFFDEQRQAIEKRLMDAGWRLTVDPADLADYATGQIALAWMSKTESRRKPFSLAMLVDVTDDPVDNERLLTKIDEQLAGQKPAKAQLVLEGVDVVKYTTKRPGQLGDETSFYAIENAKFLATDDEELMKLLIQRVQGKETNGKSLAEDEVFQKGREYANISGEAHAEYFVRPIGFASVLREIGSKRSKSDTDLLAILKNQGFGAIKCVCGELTLGLEKVDMQHHGYVYAELPLPKSAAVLDFPNNADKKVPAFVGANASSFLTAYWNASEAFWKVEGIVDEFAGNEGFFEAMINGMKTDQFGPRVDLRTEVLPQFTNEIFTVSDSKEGEASVDSRRNLIALRVKDHGAILKVLERAMKNEPDVELIEVLGQKVWTKVAPSDDDDLGEFDLDGDFSDFADEEEEEDQQNWLETWSITVTPESENDNNTYGFVMFSSHAEMIENAIAKLKSGTPSEMLGQQDYLRISQALRNAFGNDEFCTQRINRNQLAYRVQYELFRQGKLKDSESMLASILDRLLQNQNEIKSEKQMVSGENLPPFAHIEKYLHPSGMTIRSTDHGWEFGGLLLNSNVSSSEDVSSANVGGTARVGTVGVSENR